MALMDNNLNRGNKNEIINWVLAKTSAIFNIIANHKNEIINWGIPDYTAGISFTVTTNFVAPKSGIVIYSSESVAKFYAYKFYVNNAIVATGHTGDYAKSPFSLTLKQGDTTKCSDANYTGKFYPFRGA